MEAGITSRQSFLANFGDRTVDLKDDALFNSLAETIERASSYGGQEQAAARWQLDELRESSSVLSGAELWDFIDSVDFNGDRATVSAHRGLAIDVVRAIARHLDVDASSLAPGLMTPRATGVNIRGG
ncbi:MAG: hypothetical protein AAF605_09205 [Myxococcota bacterium]